jgi:hypothetical protein
MDAKAVIRAMANAELCDRSVRNLGVKNSHRHSHPPVQGLSMFGVVTDVPAIDGRFTLSTARLFWKVPSIMNAPFQ